MKRGWCCKSKADPIGVGESVFRLAAEPGVLRLKQTSPAFENDLRRGGLQEQKGGKVWR